MERIEEESPAKITTQKLRVGGEFAFNVVKVRERGL